MSRTPGSCIVPTPFLNPGISCQGKKKEYKTHYYLSALRQKKEKKERINMLLNSCTRKQ